MDGERRELHVGVDILPHHWGRKPYQHSYFNPVFLSTVYHLRGTIPLGWVVVGERVSLPRKPHGPSRTLGTRRETPFRGDGP